MPGSAKTGASKGSSSAPSSFSVGDIVLGRLKGYPAWRECPFHAYRHWIEQDDKQYAFRRRQCESLLVVLDGALRVHGLSGGISPGRTGCIVALMLYDGGRDSEAASGTQGGQDKIHSAQILVSQTGCLCANVVHARRSDIREAPTHRAVE